MDLLAAIKREERKLERVGQLQGKLSGVRAAKALGYDNEGSHAS